MLYIFFIRNRGGGGGQKRKLPLLPYDEFLGLEDDGVELLKRMEQMRTCLRDQESPSDPLSIAHVYHSWYFLTFYVFSIVLWRCAIDVVIGVLLNIEFKVYYEALLSFRLPVAATVVAKINFPIRRIPNRKWSGGGGWTKLWNVRSFSFTITYIGLNAV